jgi:hypothetical protein
MPSKSALPVLAVVASGIALVVTVVRLQTPAAATPRPQVVVQLRDHDNYEDSDLLKAVAVFGDSQSFGWLSEIQVHGNALLVFDRHPKSGSEQLFVLDKNDGSVKARLGPPGSAPAEIANSVSMGSVHSTTDASDFFVWDYPNTRVITYHPTGSHVQRTGVYAQPEKIPLFQLAWLGGDRLVTNGLFSEELLRFYALDRRSNVLRFDRSAGNVLHPREVPTVARQLSRNTMAADAATGRIVLAFTYLSRLNFYDSSGKLVRVVSGPEEVLPKYRVEGLRFVPDFEAGFRMAYVDVAASKEYVYALFSGHPAPHVGAGDEVHVFSWTGELVKVFGLDALVNWLAVDEATRRLYTVQLAPHPTIRVYEPPRVADGR